MSGINIWVFFVFSSYHFLSPKQTNKKFHQKQPKMSASRRNNITAAASATYEAISSFEDESSSSEEEVWTHQLQRQRPRGINAQPAGTPHTQRRAHTQRPPTEPPRQILCGVWCTFTQPHHMYGQPPPKTRSGVSSGSARLLQPHSKLDTLPPTTRSADLSGRRRRHSCDRSRPRPSPNPLDSHTL